MVEVRTTDLGGSDGSSVVVSVSSDGLVTNLQANGVLVPLQGAGGFGLVDYAQATLLPNLAPNPGFEQGATGWQWDQCSSLASNVVHSGQYAAQINGSPTSSISVQLYGVPVKPNTRYRVGAWAQIAGAPVADIYCSQYDASGKIVTLPSAAVQSQGKMFGMNLAPGTWYPVFWEIQTRPRTACLQLRGNIYRSTGTFWLDDSLIQEVDEGQFRPCVGRIRPEGRGARFLGEVSRMHVRLSAQITPVRYGIRVDGTVTDTRGVDRAVGVQFSLPINALGWTWWQDSEEHQVVDGNSLCRFTYQCESGIGECSIYPWCALSGAQAGISMSLPLEQGPQTFILQHNQQVPATSVTFYCGLTQSAGRHPGTAPFSFLLYSHDPMWGMRSAMERFYQLDPNSFRRRATRPLYLNYVDSERLDKRRAKLILDQRLAVSGPLVFGEGFDCVGTMSMSYDFWFLPTAHTNWLSDSQVVEGLQSYTPSQELRYYGAPTLSNLLQMVAYDEHGQFRYIEDTRYWLPHEGYNRSVVAGWGLNFRVDDDPDVCSVQRDRCQNVVAAFLKAHPASTPWQAAFTADAIEGYQGNEKGIDYRPDHFRTTAAPLTFGYQKLKVALANPVWDFHNKFLYPLSQQQGFLVCGNANGYGQCFTVPFLDIGMAEFGWDPQHPEQVDRYLRAIAYQKMWRYWHVLDGKGQYADSNLDLLQSQLKRCLALDIFPPCRWLAQGSEANMEAVRPLFQYYIPILEELWNAGWQPVTYANAGGVNVERFGQYADGTLHFTLRNRGTTTASVTLNLDRTALGVPANTALQFLDLTHAGSTYTAFVPNNSVFTLNPQDTKVIWIGGSGQVYQRAFRNAHEVAMKILALHVIVIGEELGHKSIGIGVPAWRKGKLRERGHAGRQPIQSHSQAIVGSANVGRHARRSQSDRAAGFGAEATHPSRRMSYFRLVGFDWAKKQFTDARHRRPCTLAKWMVGCMRSQIHKRSIRSVLCLWLENIDWK